MTELRPNVDLPDLENTLRDVIETLGIRERKVTDKEGRNTRYACALTVPPITKSMAR